MFVGFRRYEEKGMRRCGMLYFDCFVIGAWMFAIGWFLGAVYVQNHKGKRERPRASEKPDLCPKAEAWRLPVAAGTGAD
jgi:hypothetical protein